TIRIPMRSRPWRSGSKATSRRPARCRPTTTAATRSPTAAEPARRPSSGAGFDRAFGVGRPARPAGGVEARLDSGHSQGQGVVAGGDSGPAVDADRPLERTQSGEPLPQGGLVEEGPLMDVAGGRGALRPGNVPGPRIHGFGLPAEALARAGVEQHPVPS